MHRVISNRNLYLLLATLLLGAAALGGSAMFAADAPGSDLVPVGNADELIEIVQGNNNIMWSPLSGAVSSYTVQGWPSTDGDSELGGALVIEKPTDGSAGVIDFGEKPMTLTFNIDG